MRDAWLDGGVQGARWIEHEATIQSLLWSTRPVSAPEDRKKLLALIPTLLRSINAELDRMQISSEARKPFLDTCFEMQTAAMRGATPAAPAGDTPALEALIASALGSEHETPILEENGKLVQYLVRPEAESSIRRNSLPPCRQRQDRPSAHAPITRRPSPPPSALKPRRAPLRFPLERPPATF